jgi:hypothetical protein
MLGSFSSANLTVRFFVELTALGALGVGGWQLAGPACGLLFPVAAAVLWGLFAAPKAKVATSRLARFGTQVVVLGGGAAASVATGATGLGLAFGVLVLVNAALIALLPVPSWAAA